MLSALWTPKDIITKAESLGQKAIAITDFNAWYGLLEFYEKASDIKPILWVDINFSYDGKNMMNIVLLAKTYEWYENLIKLISIANTDNFQTIPYINFDNLKQYSKGLIWLSGWNGEIEKLIVWNEKDELILDKIQEFEDLFEGEFYLEFLTYDYDLFSDRQKIEEKFIQFVKQNNKKAVVTSNYKYINKEDQATYDVLLCIKNNWKYGEEWRPKVVQDYHIMAEQEVREKLSKNWLEEDFQNQLIETTHQITDSIDCKIPLHQLLFPKYVVPEKYEKLYKKLNVEW